MRDVSRLGLFGKSRLVGKVKEKGLQLSAQDAPACMKAQPDRKYENRDPMNWGHGCYTLPEAQRGR